MIGQEFHVRNALMKMRYALMNTEKLSGSGRRRDRLAVFLRRKEKAVISAGNRFQSAAFDPGAETWRCAGQIDFQNPALFFQKRQISVDRIEDSAAAAIFGDRIKSLTVPPEPIAAFRPEKGTFPLDTYP